MADIRGDRSEILHYDKPEFQVYARHNVIKENDVLYDISIHWHDELEITYIVKGRVKHKVNDKMVTIEEGQGIFINSRQLHLIVPDDVDCELYCLIFHPMLLSASGFIYEQYIKPVVMNSEVPYLLLDENILWHKEILDRVKNVYHYTDSSVNGLKTMQDVYGIMEQLYEHMALENMDCFFVDKNLELAKQMMSYVQEKYSEKITLDQIAEAGYVGRTKATAVFARYLNMTPIEYVMNFRLDKSLQMVEETDMTIAEIAYEVGFGDAGYYSKQFKRRTGMSPLEYRHMKKGGKL